jgi:hypothetical protein
MIVFKYQIRDDIDSRGSGVELWCLTPLSTIYQLYRRVLFVEETRVPRENHRPVVSRRQLYHIMLYRVHLAMSGIRAPNLSSDTH